MAKNVKKMDMNAVIGKLSEEVEGLKLAVGRNRSHCDEQPVLCGNSGYVNWNESHDFIKNMEIRRTTVVQKHINTKNSKINEHYKVDEKTRFPENDTSSSSSSSYVNVNDVNISYGIKNKKETYKNQEAFEALIKDHMHTRFSFENKYNLKWVEPKKQNSDTEEDDTEEDDTEEDN